MRIWTPRGQGGEWNNPRYHDLAGPTSELWEIPEGDHVGGYAARPEEYEARVVGDVRPLSRTASGVDGRSMGTKQLHPWKLVFEVEEDGDHCEMVVHLDAGDRSLSGRGRSRRNPSDPAIPQIGEELAAARALQDLAAHLTNDAWEAIEGFEQTKETAD